MQTTEQYARAFEAGALAALEHISDQWPHLAEQSEYPSVTMATAEHIGEIVKLMLDPSTPPPHVD